MATYYKYQNPSEIGAAPTLDWGTVINNVNETLQKQEQQRFENREADKKATNSVLEKLNEINLTSDPKANAVLTRGFYDIKERKLQAYKDLKAGKISRSDYNVINQNTLSSIAELSKFSTEYQTRFANFQKAVSEGKITDFSKAAQEYMGSFQNMSDKKLVYNDLDGFVYVANMDASTGKVVDGPLGMLPISSLNTEKIYNDPKINLTEKIASFTDKIQPFIKVIRKNGIETIEGIQQYSEFDNFMTSLTEAIAPDDFSKADLLTQLGIYNVDVTKSSTETTIGSKRAGDNSIVPDIRPEMKEKLKEALTRFVVANEGYKQTGTEVFAPPATRAASGDKEKTVEAPAGDITYITEKVIDKKTGKEKTAPKKVGVSQKVGNIIIPKGTGVEDVVDTIGYRVKDGVGLLIINGYELKGKQQEGGTGADKGDKTTEAKKTYFNKGEGYNHLESGATVSSYVKLITNPSTGKKFSGIKEALNYYRKVYQGGEEFDPEAYYNSQKNKK